METNILVDGTCMAHLSTRAQALTVVPRLWRSGGQTVMMEFQIKCFYFVLFLLNVIKDVTISCL